MIFNKVMAIFSFFIASVMAGYATLWLSKDLAGAMAVLNTSIMLFIGITLLVDYAVERLESRLSPKPDAPTTETASDDATA